MRGRRTSRFTSRAGVTSRFDSSPGRPTLPAVVIEKDDQYVLNHCTRYLARDGDEARHDFGQYEPGDPRARIAEAWRYPIVDSYHDPQLGEGSYAFNGVTFVHDARRAPATDVAVTGSFTELHDPVALRPIAPPAGARGLGASMVDRARDEGPVSSQV